MISGVNVKQLKPVPDERGRLMEMLRADDSFFAGFGQVYMTTAYPGVIKAWHYHSRKFDHFSVVKGMIKLALYDLRKGSKTHGEVNEFFIGVHNSILVQIPPGVLHGFKCISDDEAIIINVSSLPYDKNNPDEYRMAADSKEVPYDWARKDK